MKIFERLFLKLQPFKTQNNLENMHAAETEKANAGEFKKIEIAIFVMKNLLCKNGYDKRK